MFGGFTREPSKSKRRAGPLFGSRQHFRDLGPAEVLFPELEVELVGILVPEEHQEYSLDAGDAYRRPAHAG